MDIWYKCILVFIINIVWLRVCLIIKQTVKTFIAFIALNKIEKMLWRICMDKHQF